MTSAIKAQFGELFKSVLHTGVCRVGRPGARLLMLFCLSGIDTGLAVDLERITLTQQKISAHCDQLLYWPDASGLCLDRDERSLWRLAADGSVGERFHKFFERPRLAAINRNRIAVADEQGISLLSPTGELLHRYTEFRDPHALAFAGDRLLVADKNELIDIGSATEVRRFEPGKQTELPVRKIRHLAADTSGNIYTAARRAREIVVRLVGRDSEFVFKPDGIRKITGLATDADNNLYVLAESDSRELVLLVYRGVEQRLRYVIGKKAQVAGFGVTAGDDSTIAVFEQDESISYRIQYRQVPGHVTGLQVHGSAQAINLRWDPAPETFVTHYRVFASHSDDGEFEPLGQFDRTAVRVPLAAKRWRRFQVAAVSRSGQVGPVSVQAINRFDEGYRLFLDRRFKAATEYFLGLNHGDGAAAYEYLARSFIELGELSMARSVAQQLAHVAGPAETAARLQAEVLLQQQRLELAARQLENITTPAADILCARIRIRQQKFARAEACLERLMQQKPVNIDAQQLLLEIRYRQGRKQQHSRLAQALRLRASREQRTTTLVAVGRMYLRNDNPVDASTWLNLARKLDPKRVDVRTGLIELALARKRFSTARALALQMITEPAQQVDGYLYLGEVAYQQSKPGEAAHIFRKALELRPWDSRTLLALARCYRQLGNTQQLRATLNAVIEYQPGSPDALWMLAQLEKSAGHAQAAITALQALLAERPGHRQAQIEVARLLADANRNLLAGRHAFAADSLKTGADSVALLAELSIRQGRFTEALKYFSQLAKDRMHAVEANLQIAEIHLGFARYKEARIALENVLRQDRKNTAAMQSLIRVYRELGLYKSALKLGRRLQSIDPRPEHRLLLNALAAEGKTSSATRPADVVVGMEPLPIVVSSLSRDEPVDIARLTLATRGNQDLADILIKVYPGDLSGAAIEQAVAQLEAGTPQQVVIRANIGGRLDCASGDRLLNLVAEIHHRGRVAESRALLPIRCRTLVDWSSADSVNRFLSARPARSPSDPDSADTLSAVLRILARVDVQGFTLESHEADYPAGYAQTPAETSRRRAGSIDDLGLLFAAALQAQGQRLALVKAADRFLLLVAMEDASPLVQAGASAGKYYRFGRRYWVPLDISAWHRGLESMWEQGLTQVAEVEQAAVLQLSVGTQGSARASAPGFAISEPVRFKWLYAQLHQRLGSYLYRTHGTNAKRDTPSAAAEWYRQHGYPGLAREQWRAALVSDPLAYEAGLNLAVNGLEGTESQSIDYFRRAAWVRPFAVRPWQQLGQALSQAGLKNESDRVRKIAGLTESAGGDLH